MVSNGVLETTGDVILPMVAYTMCVTIPHISSTAFCIVNYLILKLPT